MEPEPYPYLLVIGSSGEFNVLTNFTAYARANPQDIRALELTYRFDFVSIYGGMLFGGFGYLFDPQNIEESYQMVEELLFRLTTLFGVPFEVRYCNTTASEAKTPEVAATPIGP